MPSPTTDQPVTTSGARLALTLGAPFVVWLVTGSSSPLEVPNRYLIAKHGYGIGLSPVVTAFLLVEVAAAVMPQWRALRISGPAGRATLDRAAWKLSAVLMVWDLLDVMMHVAGSLTSWSASMVLLMIMNVGWTLTLVFIARLVSRMGLVNGYALLLAFEWVPFGFFSESPHGSLFSMVAMLGLMALSAALLETRRAVQTHGELTLYAPLSGITPLLATMVLLEPPHGSWGPLVARLPLDWLRSLTQGTSGHTLVSLVLVVLFTWGFSHLFNRGALILSWLPGENVHGLSHAFNRALGHTMLFVLCLSLMTQLLEPVAYVALFAAIPAAACLAALFLDGVAEHRARVKLGHLVPVWSEQRTYALGSLSAALTQADIPHHVRGVRLRTLLPHVPLVPAELLVAPARAEAALAVLTARNADSVAAVTAHAPSTF